MDIDYFEILRNVNSVDSYHISEGMSVTISQLAGLSFILMT